MKRDTWGPTIFSESPNTTTLTPRVLEHLASLDLMRTPVIAIRSNATTIAAAVETLRGIADHVESKAPPTQRASIDTPGSAEAAKATPRREVYAYRYNGQHWAGAIPVSIDPAKEDLLYRATTDTPILVLFGEGQLGRQTPALMRQLADLLEKEEEETRKQEERREWPQRKEQ
jgi:hypothetical protein